MKLYAITGGIGTGKSTALKILESMKYTTISCDVLAQQAFDENLSKILKAIGPVILDRNELSKSKLTRLFFTNKDVRQKLEKIIHPHVKIKILKLLCYYFFTNKDIVFIEVPLFFELNLDKYFSSILIDCDLSTQNERVAYRDGKVNLKEKIEAQIDMEEKRKRATIIIRNEGDIEKLEESLKRLNLAGTGLYYYLVFLVVFALLICVI